jgi:hypothetical protein
LNQKRPGGRPLPKGAVNPRHLRTNRSAPNYDHKKDPTSAGAVFLRIFPMTNPRGWPALSQSTESSTPRIVMLLYRAEQKAVPPAVLSCARMMS